LVILSLPSSCKKIIDYYVTVDHIYINQTSQDLTMEVYNKHDEMFKSFNIENGDSIKTMTSKETGPALFYFASSTYEVGDSVIVKFADSKCLTYVNYSTDNKIFNIEEYDNYSKELMKQNSFTLYYTFTEEDYNLAVDCE